MDTQSKVDTRLMSLNEAAEDYNISESTLRLFVKSGELPAFKPGGKYYLRRRDVEAWLESSRVRK